MEPGGGQSDERVARRDGIMLRQNIRPFDGAHREACEIIDAFGIHIRHLGGLAADERASCLPAAFGDSFHHIGCNIDIELSASEVIEKKERLRALRENVVDAHGD